VNWAAPKARKMAMEGLSHGLCEIYAGMEVEGGQRMMLKIWQEIEELRLEIRLKQSRNFDYLRFNNCELYIIYFNYR